MKMIKIEKIQPKNNCSFYIEFDDGVSGTVKFTESFLTGSFPGQLKNPILFDQIYEDKDLPNMIMWPNGFGISGCEIYKWLIEDHGFVEYG